MIESEKEGLKQLFKISFKYMIFSLIYSSLVLFLEEKFGDHIYKISGQIGSVFGIAVAFFLGFRMNSSYDRWWEARKVFGELTNNTRSFITKIYVYFLNDKNIVKHNNQEAKITSKDLIDLSILYINQIRDEISNKFDKKSNTLIEKYKIDTNNKISNEILVSLTLTIETNFSDKSNIEKGDLMQHINRFYDIQGKAERIKNTPFLKIYSIFTRLIVYFYVILIPLFIGDIDLGGEASHFELLAIPIMVTISTIFLTINKLANLFGEPFSQSTTSVPVDKICATIEKNCLEIRNKI